MNRPTFLNGVGFAAALAFATAACVALLGLYIGAGLVVLFAIPAVAFAYIVYLLVSSRERTGRLTILAAWLVLAIVTAWLTPPLTVYVAVHLAALWLVRSLYYHASVVPALADLALLGLGIAAFAWALTSTGSVFLATWCFFLVQALFTAIPTSITGGCRTAGMTDNSDFERARRSADEALRVLINHS
jgi:hypothetical protein